MSRPTHPAYRASLERVGRVLRVSLAAPHRSCLRSPRWHGASADCRRTSDRLHPPGTRASPSRVGDDLVSFVARTCLNHYVKQHELTLMEFSASGLGPNTTKGITDDSIPKESGA